MKELTQIRAALLDSGLGLAPEKIKINATDGQIETSSGNGFGMPYTANVLIEEYTGDTHQLFYVVAHWWRSTFPKLRGNLPIKWEATIVDHRTADVLFELPIPARICAEVSEAGVKLAQCAPAPDVSPVLFDGPWQALHVSTLEQ